MMRILTFLTLLYFGCTTSTPMTPVNNNDQDPGSSYYVERFGARGDGRADDTRAFEQAIEAAVKRRIENEFTKGGWGATQATEIRLRGDRTYRITRPIRIPGNKNITLRSDAMGGATIVHEGKEDFAFIFEAKSINAAVLIDGINFRNAGIQLIGPLRGRVVLQNNQFLHTRGPGVSLIDRGDIPGERPGLGVVHWILWNNEFNYCDQGVSIDSESILLGTIQMNRFRFGVREAILIDGTGVVIDNNEFQSIEKTENPFIRLRPQSNFVSQIRITNNRFGSEAATMEGKSWAAPRSYLLIEDGPNYVSNIDVISNMFFTNRKDIDQPNSAEEAITINKRVADLRVEHNDFRHFKNAVVNNSVDVRDGMFRDNKTARESVIFKREAKKSGFNKQD